MQSSLLLTKLKALPPPRHLLNRTRLIDTLEAGVPEVRLALVVAPAGYGKTTLLAEWAATTTMPVAWLTIDAGDNDPERFLRYLFAAWETCQPEISDAPPGVLLSGMMPDTSAVLTALVNYATASGNEMVLVIDDAHLIEHADTIGALEYLADHLPPPIHLVIASRTEPPLPLARYRARQELLDIGAGELQFTVDETAALLNDSMKLTLAADDIARIHDRLEGWAAGLQMASLTLHAHDVAVPDIAITGRHRFIADFLRDEVLAGLPDKTRQFLLQTSITEPLCASLCNAITGSQDSQAMLEHLDRDHLFTVPLDANREWYRYHRLVADYLREQVGRERPYEVAELHRRAGAWYLDHDMPELAFDHALAAGDRQLVGEILDTSTQVRMFTGQIRTLQHWLHAVPATWFEIDPLLGLFRTSVLWVTGQWDACTHCLDDVEQLLGSSKQQPQLQARVTAIRCFIACTRNELKRAERFADTALRTLPPADESFRGGVYGALGDTYRRNGHWAEAQENYLHAIDHSDTPAGYIQSVHAFGALADLELRQGRLHEAAGYWRRALSVINDQRMWGAYPLPVIGWVHIRLAEILYEWDDLDAAREHLDLGRERAELGGDPRSIIAGAVLAARVMLARGEIVRADETLEQVRPTVEGAQFPEWSGQFDRCWLRLLLAQDKLRTAVQWSDTMLVTDAFSQPEHENTGLAVAHILLIKGDAASSDRALALIDHLVESSEATGRTGIQIEALALQSLARWARNDRASALTSLEHALRLAEPEGYVRTFVDLGLPMARNLQEARDRNVMPSYVDRLLASFGATPIPHGNVAGHLPEPLSEREREVLHKIAAGLTNREIADALFISPETVKKHTGSIYGKLAVRSRMEAVAIARELDLLD